LGVIIRNIALIAKNDLLPLPVPMTIAHCATLNRFVIKATQKNNGGQQYQSSLTWAQKKADKYFQYIK